MGMKTAFLTFLMSSILLLAGMAGCTGQAPEKGTIGAVAGGVGGGILGAQFGKGSGKTAATIAGAILGAGAGNYIGRQMDENDQNHVGRALEENRDGQTLPWRNESTNRQYDVTPTKTYRSGDEYCREFTQKINVDGQEQTAYGNACRQPDGTWKINSLQ